MIVVTGSCRTGTSLMMQTLRDMGIPIAGQAFHDDFSHMELNPHGYWELPINETLYGLNTFEYSGMAVKLFGLQFARTNKRYIKCAIVCTRNIDDAVNSTVRLLEKDGHIMGMLPTKENAMRILESNYYIISRYMGETPFIVVHFEDMINNRLDEIEKIKKSLYLVGAYI